MRPAGIHRAPTKPSWRSGRRSAFVFRESLRGRWVACSDSPTPRLGQDPMGLPQPERILWTADDRSGHPAGIRSSSVGNVVGWWGPERRVGDAMWCDPCDLVARWFGRIDAEDTTPLIVLAHEKGPHPLDWLWKSSEELAGLFGSHSVLDRTHEPREAFAG